MPSFEPLTMSSIPGYSESHNSNKKMVLSFNQKKTDYNKKKKNKIEVARSNLIEWIANCNIPTFQ